MKKIALLLTVILLTSGMAAAQWFGGGNIGFNSTGGKLDTGDTETDKVRTTSLRFNPKGGMIFGEDIWLGVQLGLSMERVKTPGDPDVIDISTGFGLAPFARYYAVRFGDFALFGEGQLGFDFTSTRTKSDGTTTDGPKTSQVGLSVFPGISYSVSDRVDLEATISGLDFHAIRTVSKQDVGGNQTKEVTNQFGFGANMDQLATSGTLTVGAIVKF